MNVLDVLLSIFLLIGLVRGLFKGFFSELAGLLSLICGIYAAIHFSGATYAFLGSFISWDPKYLAILSFAVTFFVVALLISLAGNLLTKMIQMVALGLINRLFGGIFGVLKMAFLASVMMMFFANFDVFNTQESTKEESIFYEPIRALAPAILPGIIKEVKEGDLFDTPEAEINEETEVEEL